MKVDSYEDFKYFLMGASITAGRTLWVGEGGSTNKYIKGEDETRLVSKLSLDGKVGKSKLVRR